MRGVRTPIVSSLVVLGVLACWSTPALGLTGYEFSSSFGAFAKPNNLAVDQANGNVFVVDTGANVVKVFGADGGSPAGSAPAEITGSEAPEGSFNFNGEPAGVAIDNSGGSANGDIYISDVRNHVVDKFGAEGKYICQFRSLTQDCLKEPTEAPAFGETTGVAVDAQGNVYVSDFNDAVVDEYNSAGEPVGQISDTGNPAGVAVDSLGAVYVQNYNSSVVKFTGGAGTLFDSGESFAVAVDRSNNEVYVDHGTHIAVYGEAGEGFPPLEGTFGGSEGVAINESTGDVYVSNAAAGTVDVFVPFLFAPPEVGAAEVSNITRTTGQVSFAINTRRLPTECYVVYGTTESYGSSTAKTTAARLSTAVALTLSALRPATTYHYALVATNAAGTVTGPDQTFTTSPPTPPGVATGAVLGVTQTAATITGDVDPMGLETTYEFQFGPSAAYGTQVFGNAGNGEGAEGLALALPGLAPESTVHYRLVAHNRDGTSYGADRTFTTPGFPNPISAPAALMLLPTPTVAALEGKKAPTTHTTKHKTKRKKKPKKRPKRGRKKN